ncbi:MAG TPA: fluoride efflux transporter CrcB [Flavobacteriaceae bacterium]|jgi:CrcB protein
MKLILAIGTGSFIGGTIRYLFSQFIQTKFLSTFPFGTLGVNILGCFLIGLVFGLSDRGNISQEWRLFLATGVMGGFTTFSAFSNDTVNMIRDGQFIHASAYVISSVLLGLAATFIGISIIKLL